jgi:hypothetical protein
MHKEQLMVPNKEDVNSVVAWLWAQDKPRADSAADIIKNQGAQIVAQETTIQTLSQYVHSIAAQECCRPTYITAQAHTSPFLECWTPGKPDLMIIDPCAVCRARQVLHKISETPSQHSLREQLAQGIMDEGKDVT